MNELETLQVGDLVVGDGHFRRVFTADGEGELRVYGLSWKDKDLTCEDLKKYGLSMTAYQLKEHGYKRYTPEDTIEINGKKYKAVE